MSLPGAAERRGRWQTQGLCDLCGRTGAPGQSGPPAEREGELERLHLNCHLSSDWPTQLSVTLRDHSGLISFPCHHLINTTTHSETHVLTRLRVSPTYHCGADWQPTSAQLVGRPSSPLWDAPADLRLTNQTAESCPWPEPPSHTPLWTLGSSARAHTHTQGQTNTVVYFWSTDYVTSPTWVRVIWPFSARLMAPSSWDATLDRNPLKTTAPDETQQD